MHKNRLAFAAWCALFRCPAGQRAAGAVYVMMACLARALPTPARRFLLAVLTTKHVVRGVGRQARACGLLSARKPWPARAFCWLMLAVPDIKHADTSLWPFPTKVSIERLGLCGDNDTVAASYARLAPRLVPRLVLKSTSVAQAWATSRGRRWGTAGATSHTCGCTWRAEMGMRAAPC